MSSSSRVKRLLRKIENLRGNQSKKRRVSGSDAESSKGNSKVWTPKSLGDLHVANIYNSTARSPPAELFRKDLISAMKLPDNEPLDPGGYWFISDTWKQEWERGVQVPVNPEALPISSVRAMRKKDKSADFKLPKKFVRITHDEFFSNELHQMINAPALAEKVCRYDLDDCDLHWLIAINEQRQSFGLSQIKETLMEVVIEDFETQCYENMQESILAEAGLGIEYDEDVICDVCRSPDSEEGNEMVFCDSCDICVHQACYGITAIPEGSWLCRTCSLAIKPNCILCPNKGGAMKSTRSGQKWAHVSCALWIPEVSIGCVEKMEPITKIAHIPPSRWALICCLCRDRLGACIQCSVKSCKTAYHVTCGFQNGLDMKALVEDENMQDEVKLRSYCPKHSKNKISNHSPYSDEDEENSNAAPSHKETSEDKANIRAERIQQIEAAFYKHVTITEIAENARAPVDVVELIYQYWKLKRRAAFNKPLLIPRSGENDALGQEQEDTLYARMKMFVHLRQDLERVRNLCYMVTRREKLSRSWYRLREQIFRKQEAVMTDHELQLSDTEKHAVIHACHGNNIYDRLYAHNVNCCVSEADRAKAAGSKMVGILSTDGGKNGPDSNGLGKGLRRQRNPGERQPNPYAKTYYFNNVTSRSHRRSGGTSEMQDTSETKDDSVKTEVDDVGQAQSDRELINNVDMQEADCEKLDANQVSVIEKEPPLQKADASQCSATSFDIKQKMEAVDNNVADASLLGFDKEATSASKYGRRIELIDPPLNFNPMKAKTGAIEHSPKGRLRNGCHSLRLDKKSDSQDPRESLKDDAKDDVGRDTSSKENVERLSGDGSVTPSKSEKKLAYEEKLDCCNLSRHRNRKAKLLKMQQAILQKSPSEKTSLKNRNKKTSPSSKPTQFQDKMRQESAKLHESLFSNSFKGSLAGYRIPKKSRSESESDTKQDEEAALLLQQHQQQPSLLTQSPPPSVPPSPSPQLQQPLPHPVPINFPIYKEHKIPPEPPPQVPPWNSNMAGCSTGAALLPTPQRPPIPIERRLTRRERGADELLMAPSHVNGRDSNGFSPRLVIKLRKDPNYPESPRWRRDGDVPDGGVFDFKGEHHESPPNIRLKLNAAYDKSRYEHSHRPRPLGVPCLMSDKRGGNKYSMRTRAGMDMQPLGSGYS